MANNIHWDIKINKTKLRAGEKMKITVSLEPGKDFPEEAYILYMITSEENNEIPESIIPVQISLKPGKTKQIELPDFTITDDYPPGTYSIKAAIEAKRKSISQKEIPFEIAGTSKPFKMKILLSSDRENLKNQKIFYKEDKELYVQVISKVKDIRIIGTVIDPQKNKTELTFTENYATYPLK